MSALRRKLWRELRQLRGQVLAIALVLAAGIGTWVMASSNHDTLAETRDRYYAEYRFADVFADLTRAPRSLLPLIESLPGVGRADGRISALVSLQIEGFEAAVSAQVVSLPATAERGLNGVFIRRGRLPERDDEVVLGEPFADAHGLQPGDRLAAILNGRWQTLRVAGIGLAPDFIYPLRPGDSFPDHRHFGVIWMPLEPLQRAFDLDGAFNQLSLRLQGSADEADLIDRIDALLAPYGGTGAYGRDLQVSHRFLAEELEQLRIMARLFGSIFLGVSAFLLNIVIGRLVHAQREQIALLKAFGYSGGAVARHYAELVLLIAVLGVIPGIALGAWLGRGLAGIYMEFYRFPYLDWALSPGTAVLASLFAVLAAGSGAAFALYRSYRLAPATAMRPEAPMRFRRSRLERWLPPGWLDPATRMLLRTLGRRPLRTGLSVLGIGFAIGILVMSRLQSAAIDAMIDVQLGFAQRDDLALGLVQPRNESALQELAAIPGVLAVEGFRAVPVRLRHGHRHWRGSLLGLAPTGDLKRLLGSDLSPQDVPADGLLLTDYLADELALRIGDPISIEVLEGARPQLQLRFAGAVSEYLGAGAYVQRARLNRLLGETEASNGAWLRVDAERQAEVIAALRGRPGVATISDRRAMIESFRSTMAEGILTFTLVITLMAASIAVGVVYNAARITLAERGRELASLRVLGYTQAEARVLLFGELGSLTLLALLPGFALGYGLSAVLVAGFRSELYRIPLAIDPAGYGLAGLIAVAATALSAALVRRRLDGLDLIAVLKTRE